ncbi:Calmodulin-like protein 5 [Striga hermonthica]|uniref:Calmodulin-like protein 5 n=1 Tax=Striga hermonthica TaxID=68872 RepID=A0A9N7N6K6_STRHE|nr:Calmodulin-like protein 5 [Striga hermonthica]
MTIQPILALGLHMRRRARRSSIGSSPSSINSDSNITPDELNESLENLGICVPKEKLQAMVAKIDAHGDAEEFSALYAAVMADAGGDEGNDREEDGQEAFKIFDRDRVGSSRQMS